MIKFSFVRSLLEQHMHCHREMVAVKIFECSEKNCLFSGRSAAELRVHQSTHSNDKNFVCIIENCSYKTKTNALLNRFAFKINFFFGKINLIMPILLQTYQIAASKNFDSIEMQSM